MQDLEAPGGVTNRTWTISSHPDQLASSNTFAITVKRAGLVSSWLHDHLRVGDQIGWGGVDGQFTADPSVKHAVLIGGGIGATQMSTGTANLNTVIALSMTGSIGLPRECMTNRVSLPFTCIGTDSMLAASSC